MFFETKACASERPLGGLRRHFAHYLHIVDTLETAKAFGVRIRPQINNGMLEADVNFDPYHATDFKALIDAWLPLTFGVNCLNRSMGQPDLYPFVLSVPVIDKLRYVHALVHDERDAAAAGAALSPSPSSHAPSLT
jgi:hypothetical protein